MPWPIVPAPITAMVSIVSEPLPGLLILRRTGLKRFNTPEATRFDYPNIRSYTIRSTEKAIVLIPQHARETDLNLMANETIKRDVVIIGRARPGSRPPFTPRAPA